MWKCAIFNAVLFYVCLPGVLVTLGGKQQFLVHAIVFAIAHHFLWKIVSREFFLPNTFKNDTCPTGYENDAGGDCRRSAELNRIKMDY
jgi:hypothetical protein